MSGCKLPPAIIPDEFATCDADTKRRMAAAILKNFHAYGGPATVMWSDSFERLVWYQVRCPSPVRERDRLLVTYLPEYYYRVLLAEKEHATKAKEHRRDRKRA